MPEPEIAKVDTSGGFGRVMADTLAKELPGAMRESREFATEQRQTARDTATRLDANQKRMEGLAAPPPPPPSPPPQMQDSNPIEAWGSTAMGLAMLGSAFTRRPAINALNSAAGVMRAYQQRDSDAYKRNFEQWKAQNDYSIQMYKYQHDAYKDALDLIGSDSKTAEAKLRVLMAAFNDPLKPLLEAGNLAGVESQLREREARIPKLNEESRRAESVSRARDAELTAYDALTKAKETGDPAAIAQATQGFADAQARAKIVMQNPSAATSGWEILLDPSQKDAQGNPTPYRYNKGTGEATTLDMKPFTPSGAQKVSASTQGPPDPKSVEAAAQAIAAYKQAPPGSWAMAKPFAQQVMARVHEINPNYQQAEYASRVSTTRAFTSGRQADAVRSFSVSIDHLATLEDLGRALDNGDIQRINQVKQRYLQETGNEAPLNFDFAKTVVGDEVAKAIIGGVGAHADREALQAGFDRANSWEQLNGVIGTAKKLIAGQLSGFRRQYERGTGQPDFDTLLSPESRRQLGGLERRDASGTAPAAAAAPTATASHKAPPAAAIDQLKKSPTDEMRANFDDVFGPGAAAKALGK